MGNPWDPCPDNHALVRNATAALALVLHPIRACDVTSVAVRCCFIMLYWQVTNHLAFGRQGHLGAAGHSVFMVKSLVP